MGTEFNHPARHALPALLSFLCLVFYGPATVWFVDRTVGHEQLVHAFIILGLTGAYVLMQRRERVRLQFDFGPAALRFLFGSFCILGLGGLLHWPLLTIPAYAMALLGWLLYIFGDRLAKTLFPVMAGFGGFLFLIYLLPFLDWPLRILAGRYAAILLGWMGYTPELILAGGEAPKLILDNNGWLFEVAAECNGFGVLGGCLLLAILLMTFGGISWFDRALSLLIAGMVAITANLARIVVICMLAPTFGQEGYLAMHEVVGTIFFWLALVTVWLAVHQFFPRTGPTRDPQKPAWVVFFDSDCGLCSRSMRWFQAIDRKNRLAFFPLSGEEGKAMRERHPDLDQVDSIILAEHWDQPDEEVFYYSEAILRMFKHVGGIWQVFYLGIVIPSGLRNVVYRWVARNRIKWFGTAACEWTPEGGGPG